MKSRMLMVAFRIVGQMLVVQRDRYEEPDVPNLSRTSPAILRVVAFLSWASC